MNIETFFEARDLYEKYQLCEKMMEYLSDEDSTKGQKYLETLKQFVDAFKMEFMTFVHERMEAVGMQFEDLHCPEHTEQPDTPTPPTEEKDPKFPIGSKVEIVAGIGKGEVGVVNEYDMEKDAYYIVSDKFYMWFAELELKAYEEESEEPTPIVPNGEMLVIGDKVKVVGGVWPDLIGKIGEVVAFYESRNTISVLFDFDGEPYEFNYPEIEKYTESENPEENGGTAETDKGE